VRWRLPCSLNDTAWFGEIDASGGAVFFASGVFYSDLMTLMKDNENLQ